MSDAVRRNLALLGTHARVPVRYREFQAHLLAHPDAGDVIRGSGGIRKVRWAARRRGKSGGIRVIYYWASAAAQIYLLTIYAKSEQADIAKATLRRIAGKLELLK